MTTSFGIATHVMLLSVASAGVIVAVRTNVSPISSIRLVCDRLTAVTGMVPTVTAQVAVKPPSSVVAVMVAEPTLTACTVPPDTVATEALSVLQITP